MLEQDLYPEVLSAYGKDVKKRAAADAVPLVAALHGPGVADVSDPVVPARRALCYSPCGLRIMGLKLFKQLGPICYAPAIGAASRIRS